MTSHHRHQRLASGHDHADAHGHRHVEHVDRRVDREEIDGHRRREEATFNYREWMDRALNRRSISIRSNLQRTATAAAALLSYVHTRLDFRPTTFISVNSLQKPLRNVSSTEYIA